MQHENCHEAESMQGGNASAARKVCDTQQLDPTNRRLALDKLEEVESILTEIDTGGSVGSSFRVTASQLSDIGLAIQYVQKILNIK